MVFDDTDVMVVSNPEFICCLCVIDHLRVDELHAMVLWTMGTEVVNYVCAWCGSYGENTSLSGTLPESWSSMIQISEL